MIQPHPAVESLVERVRDLELFIREQAEVADRDCQLPQALVDRFHDAGLMRMYVPQRYGGAGLMPWEVMTVIEAVSRIDASVGWALNIGAGSVLFGGLLDDEAEREAVLSQPRGGRRRLRQPDLLSHHTRRRRLSRDRPLRIRDRLHLRHLHHRGWCRLRR